EKTHTTVQKGFEQIAQGIDRIGIVAVQSHDDVPSGVRKPFFVGSAITTMEFPDDHSAHLPRDFSGSIRRVIVNDDGFIDKIRKCLQYLLYSFLLVQTRYDNDNS